MGQLWHKSESTLQCEIVKPYFKILHGNAISREAVANIIHGKYNGRNFSSKKGIEFKYENLKNETC